jgi:hypothetical protein
LSEITWISAAKTKERFDRQLACVKDIVSEYSDEEHGMLMLQKHLLEAATELHQWHSTKEKDLRLFIANLELMS